jgi:hypothetical protein
MARVEGESKSLKILLGKLEGTNHLGFAEKLVLNI